VRVGTKLPSEAMTSMKTRHLVTHYVKGSITRDLLVGKDLPRAYQLTADGHLIIRSADPRENWSVTWEHY
jgi:hypothetical protein